MYMTKKITPTNLELTFQGRWERIDYEKRKCVLLRLLEKQKRKTLTLSTHGLESWDTSLIVVLNDLIKKANSLQIPIVYVDFSKEILALLSLLNISKKEPKTNPFHKQDFLTYLGDVFYRGWTAFLSGLSFMGQAFLSLSRFIGGTAVNRKVDFLFMLDDCGPKAVGIVALISFMVGLILAFVGALQLKSFGAQIYVASLVCIGMIRIMGAIMTGIIMAGRTAASYAASIGTMQVNEELDALQTMGISKMDFIFLPRFISLIIAMPILTLLSDVLGILGGAFVGVFLLNIPLEPYFQYTKDAFSTTNFSIGILHGFLYGMIICLCGCYYGFKCERSADGVGVATTKAVVAAIVWMIVITGILTIILQGMGL